MFPFEGRGLCHAYWAPNIWALYNTVDKIAVMAWTTLAPSSFASSASLSNTTRGLVEAFRHAVLPEVTPRHTAVLSVLAMLPALRHTWLRPDPREFAQSAGVCALAAFLFGWHVHEKAVLTATLPLALAVLEGSEEGTVAAWFRGHESELRAFCLLHLAGCASLLPLIYTTFELPVKVGILVGHSALLLALLDRARGEGTRGHQATRAREVKVKATKKDAEKAKMSTRAPCSRIFSIEGLIAFYALGLGLVQAFESLVHPFVPRLARLEFLPLMLWSVYCSLGVVGAFVMYNL